MPVFWARVALSSHNFELRDTADLWRHGVLDVWIGGSNELSSNSDVAGFWPVTDVLREDASTG